MSKPRRSARAYDQSHKIDITQHVDPTRTFTTVLITDKDIAGVGVSKRNSEDPVNFEVGYRLAYARALRDLADNIERQVQT